MSNICKTVTLRTRKIKGGEQLSFYLDYYPGYRDESTMKVMYHESLGIYIYAKPKSQREKDYNDRMREKAETLRCRRYESYDFLAYFKMKADRKNCKWQYVYKHFARFCQGRCTFEEINVDLCNKFREYLLTAPQTIHTELFRQFRLPMLCTIYSFDSYLYIISPIPQLIFSPLFKI